MAAFALPPDLIAPVRLAYGARPRGAAAAESAELLRRGGTKAWLDWQLAPDDHADGECAQRLAAVRLPIKYPATPEHAVVDEQRGLVTLAQPVEALWAVAVDNKAPGPERGRPRQELAAAQVTRAIWSVWGLRELMVDFWHNHFTVFGNDPRIAAALPSLDREVIRQSVEAAADKGSRAAWEALAGQASSAKRRPTLSDHLQRQCPGKISLVQSGQWPVSGRSKSGA